MARKTQKIQTFLLISSIIGLFVNFTHGAAVANDLSMLKDESTSSHETANLLANNLDLKSKLNNLRNTGHGAFSFDHNDVEEDNQFFAENNTNELNEAYDSKSRAQLHQNFDELFKLLEEFYTKYRNLNNDISNRRQEPHKRASDWILSKRPFNPQTRWGKRTSSRFNPQTRYVFLKSDFSNL
jgi:hypothetical protein